MNWRQSEVIGDVARHQSGSRLNTGKVNHYVTDGEIAFASLTVSATGAGYAGAAVGPDTP